MDSNIIRSFSLSLLAGLSTLIGFIIVLFAKAKPTKILINSLSFASGVMLCISMIDLIPNSVLLFNFSYNLTFSILLMMTFLVGGIICSIMIDKYLPDNSQKVGGTHSYLYKIGIISMTAIIIHNIPEGIATFMTTNTNLKLGLTLTIAIALHNIPEGISIAVPIFYATNSYYKAFMYTLISGLSEPFGALLAFWFLNPIINDNIIGLIYAIIAGIMIHISCYELIPGALKYHQYKRSIIYFSVGVIIMIMSHIMFS